MCLQVLFFAPVNLLEPEGSFSRFAGRLIVSPVVRVLVFSKVRSAPCQALDTLINFELCRPPSVSPVVRMLVVCKARSASW